jgi:hypothetical protein
MSSSSLDTIPRPNALLATIGPALQRDFREGRGNPEHPIFLSITRQDNNRYPYRNRNMVKLRYYRIRDMLSDRQKELYEAAKARGETICPHTGKPLVDLSQEGLTVLAALSRKKLLVHNSTSQDNEEFILTLDEDLFSGLPRSVTMTAF